MDNDQAKCTSPKAATAKAYLLQNADLLIANFIGSIIALKTIKVASPLWNVVVAELFGAGTALSYGYVKQLYQQRQGETTR